ncbi:MAG: hypothetical protein LBS56_05045, partial [Propionibacteriaceae bacterium]|nr:hypothetical protein [Propionibacteriaceae bacterium]
LADPAPPVADEQMTQPTAVLPADTRPEELAVLLERCPAGQGSERYDGIPLRAEIGFDIPGFRGDIRETAPDGDPAVDRAYALRDQITASLSEH